ncbi:MAG: hypothetical protein A2918_04010 [Candidatus Yanofskybacteria bacterium RIFCSPLOWO2_01_FULL_42_49]|uniref:Uncharacterized protein n=1 Tax=Candidatus Yanofskybacteria bacterium RIFCSPLOWO2_01_FULL_42_49 TaxID=1802694 RepID=A0A1F8GDR2_9BACT|nr:MAG: hypothetical protein A2918_04010 [Candidatus Yanofskybacteria bacterium RIFCSPLOWO2_01_FULL_42_49]
MTEMLSTVKVRCHFCRKPFLTKKAYFVFNKEVGYHSFCSKECGYNHRKTGKWLICGNPNCEKKIYRNLAGISPFNYCSKSCAAIVNNQKYPKHPPRYCAYSGCKNMVKRVGSPFCSIKCGKLSKFKYTKEEIVTLIKEHVAKTNRVPPKREVPEISHKAIHLFGSWNNALTIAGLIPNRSHNNRMYKRLNGKAADGHLCDSVSEILIDNWLHKNKVKHSRNVPYPKTNHVADWAVNNDKVFVEYFGLANDSPRYDRTIKEKKLLCRNNRIKLIEIYPKDLYPKNLLDKRLFPVLK